MALFQMVTYVIRNVANPYFLTPGNVPVAPTSDIVRKMRPNAPVIRITGTITKGKDAFKSKSLLINAEKYRHPGTRISRAGNTYTVTVPEFQRGRRNAVRVIDANDRAVRALDSFFAPKVTVAKSTPVATPTPATTATT